MRLNKAQIEAVARTIYDKVLDPYREYNKKIKNSDEYNNFLEENDDCLLIQAIADKYGLDNYYQERLIMGIKSKHFEGLFVKFPSISMDDISRQVILETIDSASIEELIDRIIKSYPSL